MLEKWNHASLSTWSLDPSSSLQPAWSRHAGLNETGFYHYGLSNAKGPSDTFCRVRISSTSPTSRSLFRDSARQLQAWDMLRARHPLLDSQLVVPPVADVNSNQALKLRYTTADRGVRAAATFSVGTLDTWDEERNRLTNCSRLISTDCLSRLRICKIPGTADLEVIMICSHVISDGISILVAMNDYLVLLTSRLSVVSGEIADDAILARLPQAAEAQLPLRSHSARERWREAIAYVIWDIRQSRKAVTAPYFHWVDQDPVTRQQVYEIDAQTTALLVRACRKERATLGHLIYACSVAAFAQLVESSTGSFVKIGTPANARRLFREPLNRTKDELLLAIVFLDVNLPCVDIKGNSIRDTKKLWTLARMAKRCVHDALADPFYPYYSFIGQENRLKSKSANTTPRAATALSFGSSALGSVDDILSVSAESGLQLKDLSIGMRARTGECLMHSYSFQGQLRLSLIYDHQLGAELVHQWLRKTGDLLHSILRENLATI